MADGRFVSRCDTCGQVDDHPKHHYPPYTFHHDCTPAWVLDALTTIAHMGTDDEGNQVVLARTAIPEDRWHEGTKMFMRIRQAALDGTHGDDLVAHIESLHVSED